MTTENQFCTFWVDGMYFGVRVLAVQEVIRYQTMTPVPLASPTVRGLINLRGQIVAAIDLRRRLGLADLPAGRVPMNVVVRTADGVVSLLADEIGEVLDVSADAYERVPETLGGVAREVVSGIYKLKGRLLLVLDTDKVIYVGGMAA